MSLFLTFWERSHKVGAFPKKIIKNYSFFKANYFKICYAPNNQRKEASPDIKKWPFAAVTDRMEIVK